MTHNLRKPKTSSANMNSKGSNLNERRGSLNSSKGKENQPRQAGARARDAGNKFKTPPTKKKSVLIPIAPTKKSKPFNKVKLQPKKLIYTDEEMLWSDVEDSGINMNSLILDGRVLRSRTKSGRTEELNRSKPDNKGNHKKSKGKKIVNNKTQSIGSNVLATKSSTDVLETSNIRQYSKLSEQRNHNPKELSQCDKNISWQEKLRWLQPRRDVGLWVQCSKETCRKWRYCENYHDPLDVPVVWFCEMNLEKRIASCSASEIEIPSVIKSDLIENKYNAGSIVWARVDYFRRWWPAMVDDCPESFQYYEVYKGSCVPYKYHVMFFNECKLERAWVTLKNLKPFVKTDMQNLMKKATLRNIDYMAPLVKSYNLALSATRLSILERLKEFSYLSRYEALHRNDTPLKNMCCDNNNNLTPTSHRSRESKVVSGTPSTDIIPCSQNLRSHMALKSYYNVFLSNKYARNV